MFMIRVGVIGYGYWGPNIVRNFSSVDGAAVIAVADKNTEVLKKAKKAYPGIEVTDDPNNILSSPDIDAVAVITPVFSHYELARKALENGKHIFVEKPFTSTAHQAEELVELADKKGLKIMVDHTFLFTGAVKKIKELVDSGELGDLYYFDSMRVNLGLFQHDVNVIWDLAPHDLSIMDFLTSEKPVGVAATGESHFNGMEDIAYVTVYFSNKLIAHFNVNWLSPVKVRTTLIGGDKKMVVWNDLEADEKIKVYDKGVEVKSRESIYNLLVSYRSGDVMVPRVEQTEALKLEAEYFVDCVTNNKNPMNDGHSGLRVVRILEAANESLKKKGEMVAI
jgi:predicted dehydrogenase